MERKRPFLTVFFIYSLFWRILYILSLAFIRGICNCRRNIICMCIKAPSLLTVPGRKKSTEAPFPFGVFYIFSLLEYPVYFVFGLHQGELPLIPRYNMYVHKSTVSFDCPRKEKIQRCTLLANSFVSFLESYCKKHPFQWYNFFDFWHEGESK